MRSVAEDGDTSPAKLGRRMKTLQVPMPCPVAGKGFEMATIP